MKHRLQIRDYRRAMGTAVVRRLPDGRKLIVRADQNSVVVDQEGQELTVFSTDLMALIALSEMSFPKRYCSAERSDLR
jgi:hypothetical protein